MLHPAFGFVNVVQVVWGRQLKHHNIAKTNILCVFLNQHLTHYHKTMLARRIKRSLHGDDVNGDIVKTGDCCCIAFFEP